MGHRHARRTKPKNDYLHESIALYLTMKKATTDAEYAALLAEHDRCDLADTLRGRTTLTGRPRPCATAVRRPTPRPRPRTPPARTPAPAPASS